MALIINKTIVLGVSTSFIKDH